MIRPTTAANIVMIAGLAITYLSLPDGGPVAIYRAAAIGAALAIGLGIFLEAQRVRSLVRTDLLMIVALFALTLLEFFFPQEALERVVSAASATHGVEALFLAFFGLVIGRNFASRRPVVANGMPVEWSPATLFRVYLVLFFLGYLYMLWTVGFNPVELVQQMLGPRFSQPWARGQFGGWSALFGEICGLLLYLVPAVAGAVLAKANRFTYFRKIVVVLGLLFTLFFAFSSGTRNVFLIYLAIFLATYVLLRPSISWSRLIVLFTIAVALFYFSAFWMLEFRRVGLEGYVENRAYEGEATDKGTLFIDNNLPVISRLTDLFPARYNYVGSELATFAILHPVPRAVWPSKPEKVSVSIEDALGAHGYSLSSTFVGEAYMMGGYPAILLVALLYGGLAGWWNRFGVDFRSNAGVILYASGFFTAMISMRSILWTTTAMLPTIAIWLYLKWRKPSVRPGQARPAVGRVTRF
jgi:oligosaccharide repeat unit polymerase